MILHGDCLEKLKDLPDNSVDAVVTDPPYGLAFMNKHWDYDVPTKEMWMEVLRVLKPGAHLLSFGGTRTYHRMTVAIEDAGFEIRDCILWHYGSGFPKSLDVSKAIDKAAGADRTDKIWVDAYHDGGSRSESDSKGYEPGTANSTMGNGNMRSLPATDSAKQWQGWGTALKPATEIVCLARKPLSEKTVAKNVEKWGCGALNIDAGRIEAADQAILDAAVKRMTGNAANNGAFQSSAQIKPNSAQGRWPANVLFDEHAAEMLDEQSGDLRLRTIIKTGGDYSFQPGKDAKGRRTQSHGKDEYGGASRFFKVVKQSEDDTFASCTNSVNGVSESLSLLNKLDGFVLSLVAIAGLEEEQTLKNMILAFTQEMQTKLKSRDDYNMLMIPLIVEKFLLELKHIECSSLSPARVAAIQRPIDTTMTILNLLMFNGYAENATLFSTPMRLDPGVRDFASRFRYCAKSSKKDRSSNGAVNNIHPTCKPTKLMEYLIKLVTPPNGTVLDPFAGSGSTLVAAKRLKFKFIGIERELEYVEIANRRVANEQV